MISIICVFHFQSVRSLWNANTKFLVVFRERMWSSEHCKWALLHPSMIFWWLWQIVNSGRLLEHLTCLVAKKCWGEFSVETLCGASSSCSHALHMDKHQNKKSRCSNFKNCEYLACNFDKRLSLKRLLVGWWRRWLRSRGEQTPWWRRSKPGRRVSVNC